MKMQWNFGGWFGAQFGSTAWILVAAVLLMFKDIKTGLILIAAFAVPNIVGFVLWRRQRTLSCYKATQFLIATAAVFGLLAVYLLERQNQWESIQTGGTISAYSAYVIIALVFAFLMAMFYVRFGRETDE